MGNSVLWWYPGDEAPLQTIDFGERLNDLQDPQVRFGGGSQSIVGGVQRVSYGQATALRIVLWGFTDLGLAADFKSLEGHLKAGYSVAFAADVDKAWAGWAQSSPGPGATSIRTRGGNEFSSLTGVTSLSSGDLVVVQSAQPSSWQDYCRISAQSGATLTLTDAIRYDHSDTPVFVRERDFYPCLRFPGRLDAKLVPDENRRTYTFDVTLLEDIQAYEDLYEADPSTLGDGTAVVGPGRLGTTLDQLRRNGHDARAGLDG